MSTRQILPDVRYNFDIAIPKVCAYYGKNPMNCFFMAEALMGFSHPDHLHISPERPANFYLRLVLDEPEKRFWTSVYTCYCLDRKGYNEVCLLMLKWIDTLASPRILQGQAIAMVHALEADVKFFEPSRQASMLDEIASTIGSDDPNIKVWELVEKFLRGVWGIRENNMNKIQVANLINSNNHNTSPTTIMKCLRMIIQEIRPSERTELEMPLPLKLMQANDFDNNLRALEGEVAFEPLNQSYLNSPFGQILQYQSKYMRVNPTYNAVINRYKHLLFYIDFDNRLSEYLNWFKDNHDTSPPAWQYSAPQRTTHQLSYPVSNEDTIQLQVIDNEIRNWPNFQRVIRSEQPVSPKPIKKGGRSGS